MRAQSPTYELALHAHALQIAAPREWEAFVRCFDVYAAEVVTATVTAEQNEVLNAQGRAQAFMHLLKTFRECHIPPTTKPPSP